MTARVLCVEDERGMRDVLEALLHAEGYEVTVAADLPEALAALARLTPDVVLTDLKLPSGDGLQLLDRTRALPAPPPVVVLTAFGSIDSAVDAVKRGAYDYLTKPFDEERLFATLDRAVRHKRLSDENRELRAEVGGAGGPGTIQTASPVMRRMLEMAEEVARKPQVTVLIRGETGTGKEVLARAIHRGSDRGRERFVAIHCAAIPDTLLESELFGYERGAFTGASQQKRGKIELADGGTLFLDEVGDMPPQLQVKLLRVLQERTFERLGGLDTIPVDVRVLAATHRDLGELVKAGSFRADLYYRLNAFPLSIPPLRERSEDVELLALHFLRRQGGPRELTPEALQALRQYAWPGNVRELEHVVERAVVLCKADRIGREHLPPLSAQAGTGSTLDEQEKATIVRALEACRGNVSEAARMLGVTRSKLRTRLARFGLTP